MDSKLKNHSRDKAFKRIENKMLDHIYEEFLMVAHINSQYREQLDALRKNQLSRK